MLRGGNILLTRLGSCIQTLGRHYVEYVFLVLESPVQYSRGIIPEAGIGALEDQVRQ
jgi:hypothetical protein